MAHIKLDAPPALAAAAAAAEGTAEEGSKEEAAPPAKKQRGGKKAAAASSGPAGEPGRQRMQVPAGRRKGPVLPGTPSASWPAPACSLQQPYVCVPPAGPSWWRFDDDSVTELKGGPTASTDHGGAAGKAAAAAAADGKAAGGGKKGGGKKGGGKAGGGKGGRGGGKGGRGKKAASSEEDDEEEVEETAGDEDAELAAAMAASLADAQQAQQPPPPQPQAPPPPQQAQPQQAEQQQEIVSSNAYLLVYRRRGAELPQVKSASSRKHACALLRSVLHAPRPCRLPATFSTVSVGAGQDVPQVPHRTAAAVHAAMPTCPHTRALLAAPSCLRDPPKCPPFSHVSHPQVLPVLFPAPTHTRLPSLPSLRVPQVPLDADQAAGPAAAARRMAEEAQAAADAYAASKAQLLERQAARQGEVRGVVETAAQLEDGEPWSLVINLHLLYLYICWI